MKEDTSPSKIRDYFSDETQYIKFPFSFIYEGLCFREYTLKQLDICFPANTSNLIYGATTISTQIPIELKNKKIIAEYKYKINKIDDTNLLVSLLNLRRNLSQDLFLDLGTIEDFISIYENKSNNTAKFIFKSNFYKEHIEPKKVNDSDIQKIITWCKKYGYPFTVQSNFVYSHMDVDLDDEYKTIKYTLRHSLAKPNLRENFWVWEFLLRLQMLYMTFVLYVKLRDKDNLLDSDKLYFIDYTDEQREELLKKIYSTISIKCVPNFISESNFKSYENNNFPINFYADNVFDLAMYSLFVFMSSKRNTLKQCPLCLQLFVPFRNNQKYCNERSCYPQLAYKRRKSLKNKI